MQVAVSCVLLRRILAKQLCQSFVLVRFPFQQIGGAHLLVASTAAMAVAGTSEAVQQSV